LQITLPVGEHTIRVAKDKYSQLAAKKITVEKDQAANLSFKLAELTVEPGFLDISSTAGASLKIDGQPWGNIPPDGRAQIQVSPKATYLIELQAPNADSWIKTVGPVKADQHLNVTANLIFKAIPATIESFTGPAEPVSPGQSVKITWKTANARTVDIGGIGPNLNPNDSRDVSIFQNETFTIVAKGDGGNSAPRTITVAVKSAPARPPGVTSFTSSATKIRQGESVVLTWSTTDASSVSINGADVAPTSGGSQTVKPNQDTTYTLLAIGTGNPAKSSVSVAVDKAPTLIPVPTTAPAPTPPVVDQSAKDATAIRDALNRLSAAYATQLVSEVKKEWTGMTKDQEKAVSGVFSNEGFKAVAIQYDGCSNPAVSADAATINCTETTSWTADRKRSSHPMQVAITLKKISGLWKVDTKLGK
jgi:hypothetical protein